MKLNKNIWNEKYIKQYTPWDLREISPPLKNYIDHLENKNIKILIPGFRNAYEAEYLYKLGFKNVYLIDWAKKALNNKTTLKIEAIKSGLINEKEFDKVVDPKKMTGK